MRSQGMVYTDSLTSMQERKNSFGCVKACLGPGGRSIDLKLTGGKLWRLERDLAAAHGVWVWHAVLGVWVCSWCTVRRPGHICVGLSRGAIWRCALRIVRLSRLVGPFRRHVQLLAPKPKMQCTVSALETGQAMRVSSLDYIDTFIPPHAYLLHHAVWL